METIESYWHNSVSQPLLEVERTQLKNHLLEKPCLHTKFLRSVQTLDLKPQLSSNILGTSDILNTAMKANAHSGLASQNITRSGKLVKPLRGIAQSTCTTQSLNLKPQLELSLLEPASGNETVTRKRKVMNRPESRMIVKRSTLHFVESKLISTENKLLNAYGLQNKHVSPALKTKQMLLC
ncbi:PREDICTED: uncharacterized protein LOC106810797 [Priapulus caudatus]|uniref:Uncharacterized protein LOC106810797 n=1 Tax=Priapulus caudatus TaxID=37621 RepID=A0ABM1EC16_PRICU|nr:PREDICTED: uncharacterized protein LOC106810797 [Priapulus caudatus]